MGESSLAVGGVLGMEVGDLGNWAPLRQLISVVLQVQAQRPLDREREEGVVAAAGARGDVLEPQQCEVQVFALSCSLLVAEQAPV